ncbi:MAG: 4-(cytidine 5'-diphospho)-2-C-methyl-D-erythritol kinase [Muribaculaceae bacterium]|nr:4-(cytidine 5'-diphospho)-2-C-methyl-D-erythritol kinase [Muribaculaceae bacterium]
MIVFPNAKINLGLNIVAKRPDGYHDLDMVMIPVGWRDILEIVPAKNDVTTLTTTGRPVDCPPEKNLVYKAWSRLNDWLAGDLPPVDIYLHKIIPDGAGLGGGSADASFTLTALNSLFSIGLDKKTLCEIAATLGADCPFFIYNRPMLCSGTGTEMQPIDLRYDGTTHIVIAKPKGISVSTAEAYGGVRPQTPATYTEVAVTQHAPAEWRELLFNGFEPHIFAAKPAIAAIKQKMYDSGAVYASMSGSGSAVYGLFGDVKMAEAAAQLMNDCDVYVGKLDFTD